jgi:hypothetical protein
MSNDTIVLLSNAKTESSDSSFTYSEKRPGAGYHRQIDCVHTAVYNVSTFVGTIKLQATLELDPAESDWFDITDTNLGAGHDSAYWTTAHSVTFIGNFVWIRAAYNVQNGTIDSIQYNF